MCALGTSPKGGGRGDWETERHVWALPCLAMTVDVYKRQGLDSELALHAACEKFIRRFRTVEQLADKPLDQLDVPALEALWRQAKARERQEQPQG